jgi:hypothetical protein
LFRSVKFYKHDIVLIVSVTLDPEIANIKINTASATGPPLVVRHSSGECSIYGSDQLGICWWPVLLPSFSFTASLLTWQLWVIKKQLADYPRTGIVAHLQFPWIK